MRHSGDNLFAYIEFSEKIFFSRQVDGITVKTRSNETCDHKECAGEVLVSDLISLNINMIQLIIQLIIT